MKTLVALLLLTSVCNAEVLLVPLPQTPFENYDYNCKRRNHACTLDYMTDLLSAKPTPEFDGLLDSLDLNDRRSLDNFRNRLIHVLNTEEISILQLNMLITVLNEMNRIQPAVYFQMVLAELRKLQSHLHKPAMVNSESFVFIFKKRYPLKKIGSLQTTLLKIPLYILHYASLPAKTDSRKLNRQQNTPLLQGSCGNEKLNRPLVRTAWRRFGLCKNNFTAAADFENKPEAPRTGRQIL